MVKCHINHCRFFLVFHYTIRNLPALCLRFVLNSEPIAEEPIRECAFRRQWFDS